MVIKRTKSKDGSINVTDEVFNTISHMAGAIFSLVGLVVLVVFSSVMANPWKIVGFSIYGFSLFFLFLFSCLHHGVEGKEKTEELLRLFDYIAIFPLIAGTFTPLCLVILHNNPLGWSIFGVIWAIAAVGIILKAALPKLPKWVFMTLYISMGWIGAIIVIPLFPRIQWQGVSLIALGGVFYTIGAVIFTREKPNPLPGKFGFHEIWHIFVILGALSHFLLMFFYVLPY